MTAFSPPRLFREAPRHKRDETPLIGRLITDRVAWCLAQADTTAHGQELVLRATHAPSLRIVKPSPLPQHGVRKLDLARPAKDFINCGHSVRVLPG